LKRSRAIADLNITPRTWAPVSFSVKYMWPVFQTRQFISSPSTQTSKNSRSSSERMRAVSWATV
jgi:hypothetical protein